MDKCPSCGHALTKTRGTRLPEDWEPTMVQLTWAANERADLNAKSQVAMFRDYWHAKPGKDGVKLDWAATWRNWIRNARATPQSARVVQPACHAPAPREARKPLSAAEQDANKLKLATLLQGIGH